MKSVKALAALPSGRRSKWIVLVLWIVALAVFGGLAGKLTGAENNDTSSWLPKSAESTKVVNEDKKFHPDTIVPAVVVYQRTPVLSDADRAAATSDAKAFKTVPGVSGDIQGPYFEPGNHAIETIVPIAVANGGWNDISKTVDKIKTITNADPSGVKVYVAGPAGVAADSANAFKGIDGTLLYATLGVVIIILLFTYRSPVLWLLPVLSAGAALGSAQGVIYLFTKAGLVVNAQSQGILTVLVFGAGTDYALLLVARYREELHNYEDRHVAMRTALRRAGPAIVASAATVTISMMALTAAEMQSTKGLGPVCAIGIVIGLISMTTLLPALLVICGRWVFWPKKPVYGTDPHVERSLWARVGRGIARRPRMVWITTVVVLAAFAVGLVNLTANGIQNKDMFTNKPDSVKGQAIAAQYFPAGNGDPIVIIGNAAQEQQLLSTVSAVKGIAPSEVTPTATVGDQVRIEATLTSAPDSATARSTVAAVRDAVHAIPNADAKVGGNTAIAVDVKAASQHDDNVIIPLILLIVLVVLGLLLRAIVAPLMLIGTVVLSFAAALGISVFAFDHLFGFHGTDYGFPLFVFVFLVALGIDYNVFLMSRVHEESQRHGTRRGVLTGLTATGGVITSAGLVLASTFAVLGSLPIVSFAEIGFAVALGVLLDTFIVRSVLVTALSLDIGRKLWWPSALAKRDEPAPEDEAAEQDTLVG